MKRRLVVALLLVAAFVGVFVLRAQTESSFDWDWPDAPLVPGDGVAGSGDAVSVLGGPGARWAADLLATSGLLGVAPGEEPAPVWLALAEPSCLRALSRAQGGRGVVFGPGCGEAAALLGVPAPSPLDAGVHEAVGVGTLSALGPMPVSGGAAWSEAPVGWEPLLTIGGRPAALSRGRAVVFAVDPASQARALRQGDPGLADQDTDGFHGPKPNDLRPFPWSKEAWSRPGAASWTEVLIAALEVGADAALPRLWPLPSEAPSALVMTSDQDFVESSWIDPLLARVEAAGGEMTVLTTVATRQTNAAPLDAGGGQGPPESAWSLRVGHGVGAHPNVVGLGRPGPAEAAIISQLDGVADFRVSTSRMHFLAWWGHAGPLPLLARRGVAMDLSFVGIEPRFGTPGFGFGAGRPMRWHDGDTILPIWVQPTHIEDDVLIGDLSYAAGLTPEEAVAASAVLLDRAMEHRVPVVANVHPLLFAKHGGVLLDGLLAAAQRRGLPILSAERQAASATARLGFANEAKVTEVDGAWVIDGPQVAAPIWIWTAGGDCAAPLPIRPGGPVGCLHP